MTVAVLNGSGIHLQAANTAARLTRLGYSVGNAGIVQVLDAQRLQQLAEIQLVQARTQRYVQTVNLFLAAGGGITESLPKSQANLAGERDIPVASLNGRTSGVVARP